MTNQEVLFNSEIASRIGIIHLESQHKVNLLARQVLGLIQQRKKWALMPHNLADQNSVRSHIEGIYTDINSFMYKRLPAMLDKHSKEIQECLSIMLDTREILEAKRTINKTIFPGIPKDKIMQIVMNQSIPSRIFKKMQASGSSPSVIERLIAIQADPAKRLTMVRAYFDKMRNNAYAIARTGMSAMVSKVGRVVYESLPTDLVGFQVHGILDDRIRPEHRERNGTIYFKKPRYGEPGFDQMPNPPYEADGTIAYNCRCWVTPIMKTDAKKFFDFKGRIIPDAKIFSKWFSVATKERQVLAIGVKRHQAASKRLKPGEKLEWHHLLNPISGMLLDTESIKGENEAKRSERIKKAKKVITGA